MPLFGKDVLAELEARVDEAVATVEELRTRLERDKTNGVAIRDEIDKLLEVLSVQREKVEKSLTSVDNLLGVLS